MNLNLYSIIEERRWSSRAIYFTGNQCVGMGQTLTNSLIGAFTHAIFYHDYTSESRIYQLFGRICGNIKEWYTYAKTKVYCTEYLAMTCIRMENRAYSVGTHMQGKFITEADYVFPDTVLKFSSSLKNFRVFDTQQKAIDFGKRHLNYRFRTRREDRVQLCKAVMENGNLPTFDYIRRIFEQKKNEGFKPKMILTNEFKWCVVFSSDKK